MLLAKQNFSFKQEVMLKKPFLKDELDIVSERQRGERERERESKGERRRLGLFKEVK